MFSSDPNTRLGRARTFVNLIIKPHPCIYVPPARTGYHRISRSYSYVSQSPHNYNQSRSNNTTSDEGSHSQFTDKEGISASFRESSAMEGDTSIVSDIGAFSHIDSQNVRMPVASSDSFMETPSEAVIKDCPGTLRSYRQRNHKCVSEVAKSFQKLSMSSCLLDSRADHEVLASKEENCSMHEITSEVLSHSSACESRHRDCQGATLEQISLLKEEDISGFSEYKTALSSFYVDAKAQAGPATALQVVDRKSGVAFDRVFRSTEGQILDVEGVKSDDANDLSCHVVPPCVSTGSTPDISKWLGTLQAPPPALVLTFPTPQAPQSPFFISRSPITVSKFVSAAATPTISSVGSPLLPAIQACGYCGLMEFDNGTQCAECDRQWLACKVWYQANDGGRRRWLTEPYIKPAESNASNRAMMAALGIPGGNVGLGFHDPPQGSSSRTNRTLGRFRCLLDFEASVDHGPLRALDIDPACSDDESADRDRYDRDQHHLRRAINGMRSFWTKLKRLASDAVAIDSSPNDCSVSSEDIDCGAHQDFENLDEDLPAGLGDHSELADVCPRWLTRSLGSRFIEHLAAHTVIGAPLLPQPSA